MGRIKTRDTKPLVLLGRAAGESEQRSLLCSSWWEVGAVALPPADGWDESLSGGETAGDGVLLAVLGFL